MVYGNDAALQFRGDITPYFFFCRCGEIFANGMGTTVPGVVFGEFECISLTNPFIESISDIESGGFHECSLFLFQPTWATSTSTTSPTRLWPAKLAPLASRWTTLKCPAERCPAKDQRRQCCHSIGLEKDSVSSLL